MTDDPPVMPPGVWWHQIPFDLWMSVRDYALAVHAACSEAGYPDTVLVVVEGGNILSSGVPGPVLNRAAVLANSHGHGVAAALAEAKARGLIGR